MERESESKQRSNGQWRTGCKKRFEYSAFFSAVGKDKEFQPDRLRIQYMLSFYI